jgi:hypothetical protein
MPDNSEERRARLRSVAVAAASFVTLATSRAAAQIEDGVEGPAFAVLGYRRHQVGTELLTS